VGQHVEVSVAATQATIVKKSEMRSALPKLLSRKKRPPLTRSQMMARIRSRDTRPEVATRAAVHSMGLRFRKHAADLPGNPDIVNRRNKWAIFVHGCFWHSHDACRLASNPKSNKVYWTEKLRRNQSRDREKIALLCLMGFRVLVIWECEVRDGVRLGSALRRFFFGDPVVTTRKRKRRRHSLVAS
jgi:DNA mismatch endonuclease (patch repair protein)